MLASVLIILKHAAFIGILVYAGLGLIFYFAQRSYTYFPMLHDSGLCDALYKTGAKRLLQGGTTLYYREGGDTLIALYHGNGGTACLRSYLAEEFAKENFSFVFVEYAGYGDERKTTKDAIFEDVRNADAFISTLSPKRIVYMSESLGAGPLAYHTTLRTPDGIVLVSPYTRLSDVALTHFPYNLYPVGLLLKDNFDTTALREYGGKVLVVHAEADEIIPVHIGKHVFDTIPSDKKQSLFIRDAGHNDLLDDSSVLERIGSFIRMDV